MQHVLDHFECRCASRARSTERVSALGTDGQPNAVEEREGGLRYLCAAGEFHLFLSTGASPGTFTQMGFEVEDIGETVADLRSRGVVFEVFDLPGFEVEDGIARVTGNYPSKGAGERGVWFRDSEGNLLGLAQPVL